MTISGSEQGPANACPPQYCPIYDTGSVTVVVNGTTVGGAGFGQNDTSSTIASALSAAINGNGNSPVSPSLNGTTITLTAKTTGSATNYPLSVTMSHNTTFFPNPSFNITPSGSQLAGGADQSTTYDSGTVSATVDGFTQSVTYGNGSTATTVAAALASDFTNASGTPVTATSSGATVTFTSIASGAGANYSGSDSSGSTNGFNPASFSASPSSFNLTGGSGGTLGPWTLSTPAITLYNYDALGNLKCSEQHGGVSGTGCSADPSNDATSPWRVRRFSYDSLSRLVSASNPESGAIQYAYDLNGNVASKTALSPNQPSTGSATVTTTYSYDAMNRVMGKVYTDSFPGNPSTAQVQYGYDGIPLSGCAIAAPSLTDNYPVGERTSMCDGSGGTSWAHDKMGRVKEERRAIGKATISHYVYYTPNLDGSLSVLATPPMKNLNYTYNGAGRATTLVDSTDGINFATNAQYTAAGQPPGLLMSVTLGSVFNVSNTYNVRMQPLILSATGASGSVLSLTYDFHAGSGDNGNVYTVTNGNNPNRTANYTYDGLNRIASAWSSGPQWGETYTIDAWGNLTNRSGVSGKTYTEPLNAAPATVKNQLTGYVYDAAGNMTANGGYVYDAENRLVWTSGYRYVYDGNGERVEKCAAASATTACPTSGTNGKLYWKGTGSDPLAESDLAGNPQEEYLFFNGTRIARRDVSSTGATIALHYYFSDHLGTHAVVENATGTQYEQDIDYYPYSGQQNDYSTTPVAQNYKFNGKERDSESGLDNFGARYDTSNLGRWMTPDWATKPTTVPYANFGNPQSLNLYSFVKNNPTTFGDPDGHGPSCNDYPGLCAAIRDAVSVGKSLGEGVANYLQAQTQKAERAANHAGGQITGRGEFTMKDPADRAALAKKLGGMANTAASIVVPAVVSDGMSLEGELGEVGAVEEDTATASKYGSTPEGRPFTKHYGIETGPERNIPGSVVDNTINTTKGVPVEGGKTVHYDPNNDVTVVTGDGGSIVSVHKGAP